MYGMPMSIKRNDSISMIGKGIRNSSIIGLGNKGSSTFVTQNLSIIRMGMGMNVGARNVTAGLASQTAKRHKRTKGANSKLVRINVSGREFFIHDSDLQLYPYSLLGSCEKETYFEPGLDSYFFDRNRVVFEYIASFYQTGLLNLPTELDTRLINDELSFFKLNEEEEGMSEISQIKMPKTMKGRLHLFLNYPDHSSYAGVWAGIDMTMILTGILLYCLETEPDLKHHFTEVTDPYYDWLWWLQMLITIFFTTDLTLRAISWPGFYNFVREPLNILDFVSIVPFYLQYLLDALNAGNSYIIVSAGRMFRMFRVIRVVRFFRYFKEMFLILQFVGEAWKEVVLIICLTSMLLIIFGSILFYVENGSNKEHFYSILQGFWWSLTTITTVGYGDIYPISWLGQLAGSVLVIMSLVVLTLPMTIIITKFNYAYEVEKRAYKRKETKDCLEAIDSCGGITELVEDEEGANNTNSEDVFIDNNSGFEVNKKTRYNDIVENNSIDETEKFLSDNDRPDSNSI